MSVVSGFASATAPLIGEVLDALRNDAGVQSAFGLPARLYDEHPVSAYYPYAVLERCESQAADGVSHRGREHTLHFATFSRHGGIAACKELLSTLIVAIDRAMLEVADQQIVLVLPIYSDVLRTKNQNVLRGILRVRVRTEAV